MVLIARRRTNDVLKSTALLLPGVNFSSLSSLCAFLVKPLSRQWGPPCVSSPCLKEILGYGVTADRVGVVREAFLDSSGTYPEESSDRRLLVDEYVFDDELHEYRLVLTPRFLPGGELKQQSTNEVLMVSPTAFTFNADAAADNAFMNSSEDNASIRRQVLKEYANLYGVLADQAGVTIRLFQHGEQHKAPDSCFPNNWFSTHSSTEADGGVGLSTLVYYPMKCANRRNERRDDIKAVLEKAVGYDRIVDLTGEEGHQKFLEGTGSLVLDRKRGIAYVALSERADKGVAERWIKAVGYKELVTFNSVDADGTPVYHTNVMMAIGTSVAVVCLDSIKDKGERDRLVDKLSATHEIVDISQAQMASLCGNVLEVVNKDGKPVMAMSTRAYDAFTENQRQAILRHVDSIHHAPIDMLEHVGGGGVRCTLSEIFR
jgi:hypothetical protein